MNKIISFLLSLGMLSVSASCRQINEAAPIASAGDGSSIGVGVVDDDAGFSIQACTQYEGSASSGTCTPGNLMIHKRSVTALNNNPVADRSEECKVTTADGSAAAMIECLVEADELELAFYGLTLAYNVPSSMCEYVSETPFYFWNYSPALSGADTFGPSSVTYTISATGTITTIDTETYLSGVLTPDATDQVAVNASGTGIRCLYDYSDYGGPNCCSGTYTLRVVDDSVTPSTDVTSYPKWTGSGANCLAGPAMRTQPKDEDGFPMTMIRDVGGTGINRGLQAFARTSGQMLIDTAFTANHVKTMTIGTQSTYPNAFRTRGGVTPTPYYEFACLDRAQEVQARIRVYVREWNEVSELDEYRDGAYTSGDEDTTGTETGSGGAINDWSDWENIGSIFPSSSRFAEASVGSSSLLSSSLHMSSEAKSTQLPEFLMSQPL